MPPPQRVTARDFPAMKARSERIAMVTAYDYPSAVLADAAGMDALLVGDSLGMVVLGYANTVPVTLDDILHHTRAVARARTRALVVADMPFLSCHVGENEAVRGAGRLLKEGGAAAVKLEGGEEVTPVVRRLVAAGIPVMGHLGLTPQAVNRLGGFRVQARDIPSARRLLQDARALEAAGVFGIVLELVPAEAAAAVSAALSVPTIGIGAGPHCDGEVQVLHDLLGIPEEGRRRHTRRYAETGAAIREALAAYAADVRRGAFPGEEQTVRAPELADPQVWQA